MKTKSKLLLAVTAAVVFASCQKEESTPTCERNRASISGNYKLRSIEYKASPGSAPVDFTAFLDPCEKDDIIQLKNDGTWVYTDVGSICTPPGTDNGTWSLTGNVITSDGFVSGIIQSYDCKTLVCYTENVTVPGDRFTQTLIRQ